MQLKEGMWVYVLNPDTGKYHSGKIHSKDGSDPFMTFGDVVVELDGKIPKGYCRHSAVFFGEIVPMDINYTLMELADL